MAQTNIPVGNVSLASAARSPVSIPDYQGNWEVQMVKYLMKRLGMRLQFRGYVLFSWGERPTKKHTRGPYQRRRAGRRR
jgi:hypothetical protein